MSKAQRFNFTYRAYGKRSRWESYKNNNNKCKYRYTNNFEAWLYLQNWNYGSRNRVSGVLLRILFYFEACGWSRQTGSVYAWRINLLNIMIQKTLLRGRGTSIIMKLNESNKEVKIQKREKKIIFVDSNSGPFGCKLCTKTTWLVSSTVPNDSLSVLVLAKFSQNFR